LRFLACIIYACHNKFANCLFNDGHVDAKNGGFLGTPLNPNNGLANQPDWIVKQ